MTSTVLQIRPALIAASLAAVWLAMLVSGAGNADRDLLFALYARDEPWLALGALGLTYLGDWRTLVAVTLLGSAWLAYRGEGSAALTLLAASFIGRLLVSVQKATFDRLRPEEHLRLVEVHYQSFPSGHAANSTIVYLALALLLFEEPARRRAAATGAILVALLVGLSRPMLGVHWPSDVVGGWAFGLLWTALVLGAMKRWGPAATR